MRTSQISFALMSCLAMFSAAAPTPSNSNLVVLENRGNVEIRDDQADQAKKPPKIPKIPKLPASKPKIPKLPTKPKKTPGVKPTGTKDPKPSKASKLPTGTATATNKACARDVAGSGDPACSKGGKTDEYLLLEQAAKKKGATLQVGKNYLLIEKMKGGHWKAIVSEVIMTNGQLDIYSTMQQMTKDTTNRSGCQLLFGGACGTAPKEDYMCVGRAGSKFKFKGEALPEFADPETFIVNGNNLLLRDQKYNIITNNCHILAKDLVNVSKGKPVGK